MKTIFIIFGFIFICFKSIEFVGPRFGCPFKNGSYIKKKFGTKMDKAYSIPRSSVEIVGSNSKVFSVSDGIVYKISEFDNKYIIAIELGNYNIYYENLDSVLIKEKQKVSPGYIIGIANDKKAEISILKDGHMLMHPEVLLNCECKNR